MITRAENIFAALPQKLRHEHFLTLFETHTVRIERIFSRSHSSPAGFWYDQPDQEWIMLVRGHATLEFAGGELVELKEGDYLAIPPHVKHRVRQTASETIWLAVHMT
jgi:cupin 2 domain-containing protein